MHGLFGLVVFYSSKPLTENLNLKYLSFFNLSVSTLTIPA